MRVLAFPVLMLLGVFLLAPITKAGDAAIHPAIQPSLEEYSQAVPRFSKGLLWKIEKHAIRPSYLLGTIHSGDPRVTKLPKPVEQTFNRATSFTMELVTSDDGIIAMAEAMFFSDGHTLLEIIGRDLYERTERALQKRGFITDEMHRKKPWAIVMMLIMPGQGSLLPLDFVLQMEAVRQGKPVHGLETMREQIAVFNDMPMDDQIDLLKEALCMSDRADEMLDELIAAYQARDLTTLLALVTKQEPGIGKEAYGKLMERLLIHRNFVMADRMLPRLNDGNAFIAVGAAHLPGKDGLLQLLELRGYRVTPVY